MGIIKVNRKEVDVRESLHSNPMSQPGYALTHAKTTKEQFNLIGAGRRNLLINGDFQIWQRGTTVSIGSNGYGQYGPDRWGQYYANGGVTVERQSVTVDGKLTYAARCNTDANGQIYFHQHIENGSKLLSDKDYTLSFWARCNPGMQGKLEIERYFVNLDHTGGYGYQSSTEEYVEPEWKYFEFHFRDIDNTQTSHDRYFQLAIATETYVPRPDWIEFAFVQLELGNVATPFEHRSFGEELALCQRYYERSWYPQTLSSLPYYNSIAFRQTFTTNDVKISFPYKVQKARDPSVTIWNPNNNQAGTVYNQTTNSNVPVANVIGTVWGGSYINTNGNITIDNAIWFHYEADAELR